MMDLVRRCSKFLLIYYMPGSFTLKSNRGALTIEKDRVVGMEYLLWSSVVNMFFLSCKKQIHLSGLNFG